MLWLLGIFVFLLLGGAWFWARGVLMVSQLEQSAHEDSTHIADARAAGKNDE